MRCSSCTLTAMAPLAHTRHACLPSHRTMPTVGVCRPSKGPAPPATGSAADWRALPATETWGRLGPDQTPTLAVTRAFCGYEQAGNPASNNCPWCEGAVGKDNAELLGRLLLPLPPQTSAPIHIKGPGIDAVHDTGGVRAHDLHLAHCLAVMVGHLQRCMAEQRFQRERIAVAQEMHARERVAQ